MALVTLKGKVVAHGTEWDVLEEYGSKRGQKPVEVLLWRIERSRQGYLIVTYQNGAHGTYIGDTYANLNSYINSLDGWPEVTPCSPALPSIAAVPEITLEQPEPKKGGNSVHVRRTRQQPVESQPQVRVRRVRPAH